MSIFPKLFFNFFTAVKSVYVPPAWLTAFIARVVGDGGTLESQGHTVSVYNNVITYSPTVIQTCDTTKATAQNFAVGSEDISNATYWTPSDVTTASSVEPSPLGGSGVTLITEAATTSAKGVFQETTYQASIVLGQAYTISAYFKKGAGATAPDIIQVTYLSTGGFSTDFYANYDISAGVVTKVNGGFAGIENVGGGWYRVYLSGVAQATGALGTFTFAFVNNDPNAVRLPSYTGSTNSDVYIWGAQFVQGNEPGDYTKTTTAAVDSTGTLYNVVPNTADFNVDRNGTKYILGSSGTIIPVPPDKPSIEFNTDGSYKGLLVEYPATNICLQSEDFTTTWVEQFGSVVTANDAVAPDGNVAADKVTRSVAGAGQNNTRVRQLSIPVFNSTTYTLSVFIKNVDCNGGSTIGFRVSGGTLFRAKIDWSTNTIANDSGTTTQEFIAYPNDWYRASVTFTTDGTSGTFEIDVDRDNVNDLTSILVWGAQLETGQIASSYIPTASATVTRVKDNINLTSASSLIGQTEGTIYVEVDWRSWQGVQYILALSDNSLSNRIFISKDGGLLGVSIRANNASVFSTSTFSSGFDGVQRFAFAYKSNDYELYRNGSSIKSDTTNSLAFSSPLTDIDLGQDQNGFLQSQMWIRSAVLYDTRLIADNLEALTRGDGYFFGVNTDQFGTSNVTFSER